MKSVVEEVLKRDSDVRLVGVARRPPNRCAGQVGRRRRGEILLRGRKDIFEPRLRFGSRRLFRGGDWRRRREDLIVLPHD